MSYVPGKHTIVTANGVEEGVIEGEDFADALFRVIRAAIPCRRIRRRPLLGG